MFATVDAARLEPGLLAIFEPRIEQFSFASAKETGGVYCAVTIRYQIYIYAPNGELVDTLTLTGYGSGRAPRSATAKKSWRSPPRGDARCGGEIPHAVPGPGPGEAAAGFAGADAESETRAGIAEAAAAIAEMTIEAVPINEQPVVATAPPAPLAPPASSLRLLLLRRQSGTEFRRRT